MGRIFCKDKKGFCDCGFEYCRKCQFAKGNGVIYGNVVHDVLVTLFGPDYDIDRLRELVDADKAGRCVVLPCKVGDKVYHITTCESFPQVYDGTLYGDDGGPGSATGLYCPCELAENCPFPCEKDVSFDCDKHRKTLAVFEDVVKDIVIGDTLDYVGLEYSGAADFDEFGKYIFPNRESAESALAKEE